MPTDSNGIMDIFIRAVFDDGWRRYIFPRVNFDKNFNYYLSTNAMPLKMQLHLCRGIGGLSLAPFSTEQSSSSSFFHFSNFTQLELNAERAHDVMNLCKSKHITPTVEEQEQKQPDGDGTYTKCILRRVFIIHFSLFFMCSHYSKIPFCNRHQIPFASVHRIRERETEIARSRLWYSNSMLTTSKSLKWYLCQRFCVIFSVSFLDRRNILSNDYDHLFCILM